LHHNLKMNYIEWGLKSQRCRAIWNHVLLTNNQKIKL
jgi:hypothetical protein